MTELELAQREMMYAAEAVVTAYAWQSSYMRTLIEALDKAGAKINQKQFEQIQAANAALEELLRTPARPE